MRNTLDARGFSCAVSGLGRSLHECSRENVTPGLCLQSVFQDVSLFRNNTFWLEKSTPDTKFDEHGEKDWDETHPSPFSFNHHLLRTRSLGFSTDLKSNTLLQAD